MVTFIQNIKKLNCEKREKKMVARGWGNGEMFNKSTNLQLVYK